MGLTDLKDAFVIVYLRVPEGSEEYWVERLTQYHDIIRWAELNNIVTLTR